MCHKWFNSSRSFLHGLLPTLEYFYAGTYNHRLSIICKTHLMICHISQLSAKHIFWFAISLNYLQNIFSDLPWISSASLAHHHSSLTIVSFMLSLCPSLHPFHSSLLPLVAVLLPISLHLTQWRGMHHNTTAICSCSPYNSSQIKSNAGMWPSR